MDDHPSKKHIDWIIKTINTELKFSSEESELPGIKLSLQSQNKK